MRLIWLSALAAKSPPAWSMLAPKSRPVSRWPASIQPISNWLLPPPAPNWRPPKASTPRHAPSANATPTWSPKNLSAWPLSTPRTTPSTAPRARLEQARAQSRISGNQTSYGTLSSEFPAVVSAVLADAGQVMTAGQAVLRVARPEEKEVAIAIPESRLAELKAAKNLAVSLWADPKIILRGELRELSPAADPATRTYAARIRIDNPPPEVRLGMTARVILDGAADSKLLVPLSAVIDLGQGPLVRIVRDGKVASRPVQVAHFREDGVELNGGLEAGELVIISGAGKLVDGQEVQAKAATTPDRQR